MSGATLLHDIGYVASGTASSYEALVAMNELVRYVKAYLRGVTIDAASLAVEEIAAVGPGGTHLARKYSRQHLRDYFRPELIVRRRTTPGRRPVRLSAAADRREDTPALPK